VLVLQVLRVLWEILVLMVFKVLKDLLAPLESLVLPQIQD
jgi:hypothetical protein